MKKIFAILILSIIIQGYIQVNPCKYIDVKPFETNHISIKRKSTIRCIYFTFENPSEGNIILKLAKSNSYTSYIYVVCFVLILC